jgi:hypothetical protein
MKYGQVHAEWRQQTHFKMVCIILDELGGVWGTYGAEKVHTGFWW